MTPDDSIEFTSLLDSTCSLLTRGQYTPNEASTGIFFRALAPYPMAAVRDAFAAHVTTSRFSPTPADILDQIRGATADDGRPGAEEAWSIALAARDEVASVVWTTEIAEAWGVARAVLPDKIGARMAFKEAYERIVAAARQSRRPMFWELSEGHDPALRADALRIAAGKGIQIAGAADLMALPAPREQAGLLAGYVVAGPNEAQRAVLAKLRDALAGRSIADPAPSADHAIKVQTAQMTAASVARVEAYIEQQKGAAA